MNNRPLLLGWYEARKYIFTPWMLLFLVLFLCLNGWKLKSEYDKKTDDQPESYEQLYEKWKGPITMDTITDLMTIYGPLERGSESFTLSIEPGSGTYTNTEREDWRFLMSYFKSEMEWDYLYVNKVYELVQNSKAVIAIAGDSQLSRQEQRMIQLFSGRKIPAFADTKYIEVWQEHDFSSLLVLLLCLFAMSPMFVNERDTGMYMLQRTARFGGNATAWAKLVTTFLFVCVVSLLFYGEDILVLQALSGHPEALSSPVYAISAMADTPLTMTIGEYILWSGGFKLLGIWVFSLLFLLLSCLLKELLTVFFTGAASVILLSLLQSVSATKPYLQLWNPAEAVFIHDNMRSIHFLDLFSQPVLLHQALFAGLLVVSILLLAAIHWKNPGRRVRSC